MSDKKQNLENLIPTVRLCIQRRGGLHCRAYNGKKICRLPLNPENPEKYCPYQGPQAPFPSIINPETGEVERHTQRFMCQYNGRME